MVSHTSNSFNYNYETRCVALECGFDPLRQRAHPVGSWAEGTFEWAPAVSRPKLRIQPGSRERVVLVNEHWQQLEASGGHPGERASTQKKLVLHAPKWTLKVWPDDVENRTRDTHRRWWGTPVTLPPSASRIQWDRYGD